MNPGERLTTRRQSRELALQVLFQQEFANKQTVSQGLEHFRKSFAPSPDVLVYANELLEGVTNHIKDIDAEIQKCSAHWTLKRMALVDLIVMRVATFELKYSKEPPPPAVVLDEAIEISKKYGTVDSAAFVNGILDQIVKHL